MTANTWILHLSESYESIGIIDLCNPDVPGKGAMQTRHFEHKQRRTQKAVFKNCYSNRVPRLRHPNTYFIDHNRPIWFKGASRVIQIVAFTVAAPRWQEGGVPAMREGHSPSGCRQRILRLMGEKKRTAYCLSMLKHIAWLCLIMLDRLMTYLKTPFKHCSRKTNS